MALSQRMRSSIYVGLHEIIGEEEAEALLAQFPNQEADEPLRRQHLDVGLAEVRLEMSKLEVQMSQVRVELKDLEVRMADRFRAQTTWMVALVAASTTVTSTVVALVR